MVLKQNYEPAHFTEGCEFIYHMKECLLAF